MKEDGVAIPFSLWAEKLYLERQANFSKDDPESDCLPFGVPGITTTPYPFRIMRRRLCWLQWKSLAGRIRLAHNRITARGGAVSPPKPGHLEIENTIDDPKAFTKPWSFTTHPAMLKGELMEYICQENNKDVQHLGGK